MAANVDTLEHHSLTPKRSIMTRFPRGRSWVRKRRLDAWRVKAALQFVLNNQALPWPRQVSIAPTRISQAGMNWDDTQALRDSRPKIVGGDWDRDVAPIDQLDTYRTWRARFASSETDEIIACCRAHLAQLDKCAVGEPSPIMVRVGRDGQLLLAGGHTHLFMAQMLELTSIPVQVTWWHRDWALFRLQLLDYARQWGGKLYQPPLHPTLYDIPVAHDDLRFELIQSHMPTTGGTLLDIGANLGYFCHRFEEAGFHGYAVERSLECFYIMNRLRIAEGKHFTAVYSDIFEFWEKSEFDVVLALNVFHHFLKTRDEYDALKQFLQRIRAKVIFFEPHLPDEPQMSEAYRNFGPTRFVEFVASNTGLPHWTCIGQGEEGRPIYMLRGD